MVNFDDDDSSYEQNWFWKESLVFNRVELPENLQNATRDSFIEYGISLLWNTALLGLLIWASLMFIMTIMLCIKCCIKKKTKEEETDSTVNLDSYGIGSEEYSPKKKKMKYSHLFTVSTTFLVLFGLITACAGAAYGYGKSFSDEIVSAYDGGLNLVSQSAFFLCNSEKTEDCDEDSVGTYITEVRNFTIDTFSNVEYFLNETESILIILNYTSGNISAGFEIVYSITDILDRIESNVSSINSTISYLSDSSNTYIDLSDYFPELSSIPSVGSENRELVDETLDTLTLISDDAESLISKARKAIKSTLESLKDDVSTKGSLYEDTVGTMDSTLDKIYDIQYELIDQYDNWEEKKPDIEKYSDDSAMYLALLIFLPAVVLFFSLLFAWICTSSKFLCPSACFAYFFLIMYCFLGGFLWYITELGSDICSVHESWILSETDGKTQTIGNITIDYGEVVMDVLTCPYAVDGVATSNNNFADIFNFSSVYNFTKMVDKKIASFEDSLDDFDQESLIDSAQSKLDNFTQVLDLSFKYNISAYQKEVDSLTNLLPPEDFDVNSKSDRDKFDNTYGEYLNFTFADYHALIMVVNGILSDMVNIPSGYYSVYNYSLIENFTVEVVKSDPNWVDSDNNGYGDTYPSSDAANYGTTSYLVLITALNSTDAATNLIDEIITENGLLIQQLDQLSSDINNIQHQLNLIDDAKDDVYILKNQFNKTFITISNRYDNIIDDIDDLISQFRDIIDLLMSINSHSFCGFIGDFYINTLKGTVCQDMPAILVDIIVPVFVIAFTLFVIYYLILFQGDYFNQLKNKKSTSDDSNVQGIALQDFNSSSPNNNPNRHTAFDVEVVPNH